MKEQSTVLRRTPMPRWKKVKTFRNLASIFSFLFFSLVADAQNAPADLSFIIGTTPGAPAAGSDTLVLQNSAEWNIRLYRGRLKQPTINDGSGVYYTKNLNSDTLKLIGSKWRTGELVQIEFYKSTGAITLNPASLPMENINFAIASPGGDPIGASGAVTNPTGWVNIFSKKKALGTNSYIQFVPHAHFTGSGYLWIWLVADNGQSYNLTIDLGTNTFSVSFNGGGQLHTDTVDLENKYIRMKKTDTSISFEYSSTPSGPSTVLYTFSANPISPTSGIALGLVFHHSDYTMSIDNAKLVGESFQTIN